MIRLMRSASAWGTPEFERTLKAEIEQLDPGQLPLQQGLASSSYAVGNSFSVRIIAVSESGGFLRVRAGIFYAGVIAGCSCADDPTPVDELSEYCEVRIEMDKKTGAAVVTLLE